MAPARELLIVAADHPALDHDVEQLLADLRAERRYFGPSAAAHPKPFRSLIDALARGDGFRLAAVDAGRVVALARLDGHGELRIAVAAGHRGNGVGTALGRAVLARAAALGYDRVVLRTSRRSGAARRIDAPGHVVVYQDRDHTDLIVDLSAAPAPAAPAAHTARTA